MSIWSSRYTLDSGDLFFDVASTTVHDRDGVARIVIEGNDTAIYLNRTQALAVAANLIKAAMTWTDDEG